MVKSGLLALTLLICSASYAQSNAENQNGTSYYVGIGFGQSDHNTLRDPVTNFSRFEDRDSLYKLVGGYQITPSIAVEISYTNLGATSQSGITVINGVLVSVSGDTKASAYTLAAKFSAFSGNVSASQRIFILPYFKVGAAHLTAKPNLSGSFFGSSVAINNRSADQTNLFWGVGAEYQIMRDLSAILEYESFGKVGGGTGEAAQIKPAGLSLGVLKRF